MISIHERCCRRAFLRVGSSAFALYAAHAAEAGTRLHRHGVAVTGIRNDNLRSCDDLLTSFLAEHNVPGAAVAVTKDSRLVYARGFGYADVERRKLVQPDSQFRLCSLSKAITSAAIWQQIERGKLKLEDRPLELLDLKPHLADGAKMDPRLAKITVLQLLQHTGGWDRHHGGGYYDPVDAPQQIAREMGVPFPPTTAEIIRHTLGRPLHFDPGTRYAYSNFGYCVLARTLEKVTGRPYVKYVREHVLRPLGIGRMQIGKSTLEEQADSEVTYYDPQGRTAPALMGPAAGKPAALPYALCLDVKDAEGAWIGSAIDYARFASCFDKPNRCPILSADSIASLLARPAGPPGHDGDVPRRRYYGCGWSVVWLADGKRFNAFHFGGLPGSSTLVVRRHDGLNWVVLFNASNKADEPTLAGQIDGPMHAAADAVKHWPDYDLFDE